MIGLAEGNPGALTCLLELEKLSNPEECYRIEGFFNTHRFKGPTLYMLWNDLCDRNTEKLKAFALEASFYDRESRNNRMNISF